MRCRWFGDHARIQRLLWRLSRRESPSGPSRDVGCILSWNVFSRLCPRAFRRRRRDPSDGGLEALHIPTRRLLRGLTCCIGGCVHPCFLSSALITAGCTWRPSLFRVVFVDCLYLSPLGGRWAFKGRVVVRHTWRIGKNSLPSRRSTGVLVREDAGQEGAVVPLRTGHILEQAKWGKHGKIHRKTMRSKVVVRGK